MLGKKYNKNAQVLQLIETQFATWQPEEALSEHTLYSCVNTALYRIQYQTYQKYINPEAKRSDIDPWIQANFPNTADSLLHRKLQQLQTRDAVLSEATEEVKPGKTDNTSFEAGSDEDWTIGLDFEEDYPTAPCSCNDLTYPTVSTYSPTQNNLLTDTTSTLCKKSVPKPMSYEQGAVTSLYP